MALVFIGWTLTHDDPKWMQRRQRRKKQREIVALLEADRARRARDYIGGV